MLDDELFFLPEEISHRVLVVGGGVAGLQAALDVASLGYEVALVEREPSLGGRVAQLAAMYPDMGHPVCHLRETMVRAWEHPLVTVLTNARIERLDGFAGRFEASVRLKSRRVDESTCDGCGKCWRICPARADSEFDLGMGRRPAIYLPYPQAIPSVPVVDEGSCLRTKGESCSACLEACPPGSIDFERPDSEFAGEFGAVVLATGLAVSDPAAWAECGYGRFPDVISSVQMERMLASAGPTLGEVARPSDGARPKSVAFVCCAETRDGRGGRIHPSGMCCAITAKQVILLRRLYGDVRSHVFYSELAVNGKGAEDLVLRAREECGARYVRSRVKEIVPRGKRLIVRAQGGSAGLGGEVEVDLVVLALGLEAWPDTASLAGNLGAMCDEEGLVTEAQRHLRPVETSAYGVFVAGSASGPREIGECVAQGSAVAVRVVRFFRDITLKRPDVV